ncbi:hypothetical protein L195_g023127 [Trifolium pratense]|uniref:Uncharacterized protein n=1 Tax=Trifolium pratense TaxID=57577 RepID=A0A2K3NA15_TRIPR|nr:hypothetical protein L195_g023127 [Trifolium pratense]
MVCSSGVSAPIHHNLSICFNTPALATTASSSSDLFYVIDCIVGLLLCTLRRVRQNPRSPHQMSSSALLPMTSPCVRAAGSPHPLMTLH